MWHIVDVIAAIPGRPRILRSVLQPNGAAWFVQFDSALFKEVKVLYL